MADTTVLVWVSQGGRAVADPGDDVRGHRVRDCDGVDIGTVADLVVDSAEGKVRFLSVDHNGMLELGPAMPSFVPVEAVIHVTGDEVHIEQTWTLVIGAPRSAPTLAGHRGFYQSLYEYYGYLPFWSPGHVYPPFPQQR